MRIFLFGSLHRIETFFDFFFVSNIFRIPSVSLSLPLSTQVSLTNPARDCIYLCVSRSIRSASSDVLRNILFDRERNFDTLSSSSNCFYPSWGSFGVIFQRDGPSCYSTLPLRSFASRTKRRNVEAAGLDRWVGRNRGLVENQCERGLCTRINTETWSLELIPEPSKVHLETPATASRPPLSSKSNLSYVLFPPIVFKFYPQLFVPFSFTICKDRCSIRECVQFRSMANSVILSIRFESIESFDFVTFFQRLRLVRYKCFDCVKLSQTFLPSFLPLISQFSKSLLPTFHLRSIHFPPSSFFFLLLPLPPPPALFTRRLKRGRSCSPASLDFCSIIFPS